MTHHMHAFVKQYAKEIMSFICALAGVANAISLWTYHATDSSWFFYTTISTSPVNFFGSLGATIAATQIYFFGVGAWCIPLLFFVCTYAIVFRGSIRAEWDRMSALMVLLCAMSTLYATLQSYRQAGMVGIALMRVFSYFSHDIFLITLFLYALIMASIIIVARECIWLSAWLIIYFMHTVCSARFWRPIIRAVHTVLVYIVWPFKHVVEWMQYIAQENTDAQKIHSTSNIVEHNKVRDIENIIMRDDAAARYEEQLWEEYLSAPENSTPINLHEEHSASEELDTYDALQSTGSLYSNHEQNVKESMQKKLYALPDVNIFIGVEEQADDQQLMMQLEQQAKVLEEKLERFGVSGKVVSIKRGPVVTLFEYRPHIDSKISKIIALEDDLALALQALSIRIIAPIPGRSVVGFEVANKQRKSVFLAAVLQSPVFAQFGGLLPLALGEDTIGNTVVVDLARMPHLLIAGSTGSGKSVALNAMLVSLLCKLTPEELRLILIDPKRLEFASYADIAHLLFPIVTNPKEAAPVLRWVVRTMEERYELMATCGARNVEDYNRQAVDEQQRLSYIVVIIDELSDLMMTAGKEIEDLIARITQMARAAGIHLIVATQRPSVDVITGLIKVNFPSRISFRVTSKIDSRTILDCAGADKLLGRGDMLFLDSHEASLKRIHGAYVSDKEIEDLVAHIRNERPTQYLDLTQELAEKEDGLSDGDEALYQDVLQFLETIDDVSISLLQRKFKIGYNRSARIIDMLEAHGHIGPSTGSKTRKVLL